MIELDDIKKVGKAAADKAPVRSVGKAVAQKAMGMGPGPIRAGVAATVVGFASAALTYRALRDGLGGDDSDEDD
jgi:hypothetical protein